MSKLFSRSPLRPRKRGERKGTHAQHGEGEVGQDYLHTHGFAWIHSPHLPVALQRVPSSYGLVVASDGSCPSAWLVQDVVTGLLSKSNGTRRITSYPVGPMTNPDPNSSWLQDESTVDGTHLSHRLVRPRKGTVAIHPGRSPQRPSRREVWSVSGLEDGIVGDNSQGQEAPQGDHQLARQGDDGDPPDPATLLADPLAEPAAERALRLVV